MPEHLLKSSSITPYPKSGSENTYMLEENSNFTSIPQFGFSPSVNKRKQIDKKEINLTILNF